MSEAASWNRAALAALGAGAGAKTEGLDDRGTRGAAPPRRERRTARSPDARRCGGIAVRVTRDPKLAEASQEPDLAAFFALEYPRLDFTASRRGSRRAVDEDMNEVPVAAAS